jgi:hypothetical protein
MIAPGSGLGLAIVRQIVHLSGGRLVRLPCFLQSAQNLTRTQGVQSRKNKGAMFWVELVYALATPDEVAAAREAHALASPGEPPAPLRPPPPVATLSGASDGNTVASSDSEFPPAVPHVDLQATARPPLPVTPLPKYESRERPLSPASAQSADAKVPADVKAPAPATAAPLASPSAFVAPADDPLTVLVVDDDPMTRTLMTRCAPPRPYLRGPR